MGSLWGLLSLRFFTGNSFYNFFACFIRYFALFSSKVGQGNEGTWLVRLDSERGTVALVYFLKCLHKTD